MKKVLVLTGGGDCPGLNAVIRGIVKRALQEEDWQVFGSIEAYNGVLNYPEEIIPLDNKAIAGIHVKGGTILKTTTKGGPFSWPVQDEDGSWTAVDRSDEMIKKLKTMGFDAVISIGGDGSQRISHALFEKGLPIIGVPKTIDNDLSSTDYTFGFQTAVQEASEAIDKLVTTAESHHRVMILEVMGRSAGWIALHAAISSGAEVCLIPEIPYDIKKVQERIEKRYNCGKGFAVVVVAEGAMPKEGTIVARASDEVGYENLRLGGVAYTLSAELKASGCTADIREMVLGHLQRGGTPVAFDRVLATQYGVKAFEMVLNGDFGQMVAFKNNQITQVSLLEATKSYNFVDLDSYLLKTAKGVGISFGE
ncbi:6-phosphofructokinase [Chondrinema litorale]|uniref:6-phosphofructokinase n=1 Tax=Chondrinema litorale TaxID=2994555 RepID=UPI002542B471|nr:ATP-dependent 6-phosphofructokinase [Chondrinema litorale]UZR98634.1 ATP-dependent 6-phosphofructokinase [Chondrinema litorale]